MTALELISFINYALFIGLFAVVLRHALRTRARASWNTVLLFGSVAGVIVLSRLGDWLGFAAHPAYSGFLVALLALAPFAMVRLVDDFSDSPRAVQVAAAIGYVAFAIVALIAWGPMEQLVELLAIVFLVAAGGYAGVAFAREARRSRGITRRRMTAVTVGAVLLIAAITVLFVGALVPAIAAATGILAQVGALGAAISFFLGFAPPAWVRRAWREPDLSSFLERSIHLAGVSDEREAILELNAAAATTYGARGASIGVAESERGVLRYVQEPTHDWVEYAADRFIAGRAFQEQRRIVAGDAATEDPDNAEFYRDVGARAVIATPVTTESRRLGVLSVFAERMSVFAEDDLWLMDLLADQSAILLEARSLAEHASELRAREEAARMKEEFLSAAAHDLRTPLTVVLGQAELLERRRQRNPDAPVDAEGLARIAREARRLSDLVTELLDAQRLEQGGAVMDLASDDLLDVVEQVRRRYEEGGVPVAIDRPATSLVASIDRPRVEQVLDNLVENAIKYSPAGDPPEIRVVTDNAGARISVVDHGIGIPEADRSRIFERFFRASNAQDITDTGLGLGLYICRRIVEEHGGRIWFEPTPGGGTTFSLSLPLLSTPSGDGGQPRGTWRPDGRAQQIRELPADA